MSAEFPAFREILLRDASFAGAVAELCVGQSISVDGVAGSSCALAAAAIAEKSTQPLLIVTPNPEELDRIADDLLLFSESEILSFPPLANLPKSQADPELDGVFAFADDLFGQRLRVLKQLAEKSRPRIVVASIAALLQPVPSPKLLAERTQTLRVGAEVPLEMLRKFLVEAGYHNTSAVDLPGEFAVRGYILDIFAPDWALPIRIEFFDDEIESLRRFDIATQRSLENIAEVSLTRIVPNEKVDARFLDYLPEESPIVLVEPREIEESGRTCLERYGNPATLPTVSETLRSVLEHPTATFSALAEGAEEINVRLPVMSVERLHGDVETVRRELSVLDTETIFIFCPTDAEAERLGNLFADLKATKDGRLRFRTGRLSKGFQCHFDRSAAQGEISPPRKNKKIGLIGESEISPFGRNDRKVVLLSSSEMFGRHDVRRPKQRQLGQVIDSFLDLKPGDYVVHVAHGIAVFRGIQTLTKGQQEEEHLHLEFAEKQAIYVPVSKIGLVQKYVAGAKHKPKLAKLGGQLWSRHKKAVQEAVFDLAEEMIELQARRAAQPGIAFPGDSDWQREFDAAFPYRETNDQLLAIDAVKQDMEQPKPMDRLLCGDVGFGKTEVAIRAAFKAIDAGYQVAVLVPTTILAEQHARTFSERMREFPFTVAALSRFQSKKEQAAIVDGLAKGSIDVVIGTHRVASEDISFKNLGLVVIDEEQRFGVHHKERLKMFRDSVDVLTMTATPIPRTLHFSLLGIREISNLETPPEDRFAVETHLVRSNDALIRSAVLRELDRDGQIFFVHNRVNDIETVARNLQRIVPECRIGIGHAQMSDEHLESVMMSFVNHEFDMLLSTTIIESGLDIPNANTIFIDEADHYGLADLHQLRGRVGRFKHQAYCYLLLAPTQMLTSQAAKRLRAIEEYSHLGSGFHLAMRDLEIRGAGNILGTQQSGHIAAVGYEMYCGFLEAAVRTLKQLPPRTVVEVELDLPGLALIPKTYIDDQRLKIDLYKRLTRVATREELDDLRSETIDRYGRMPAEVSRLFLHTEIRTAAHRFRIRTVRLESGLAGDSGYVVFEYVSQKLMDELRNHLHRRRLEIRFSEEMHAFVPMPLSKTGDPDDILDFVVSLLKISPI